jgi:uncharacterized membrane protein
MNRPADWVLFIGRFHPLLVHLPIGLIVLLAALELLACFPRLRSANSNAGVILALLVPSAGAAALCGWLLSHGGGYNARLLQWHKWAGIGTALACALTALLYGLRLKRWYRACLFSTLLLLTATAHLGGSLTYGSDYLVRYAPNPLRRMLGLGAKPVSPRPRRALAEAPAAPPDRGHSSGRPASVFQGVIEPIFQANCVSCHGPQKSKGGLRLDSYQALMKGGHSGRVVVPGNPLQSELLRRLFLPDDDDDHMPPEGKPQPSWNDILLLKWWTEAGAPNHKTVKDLKPPACIERILAHPPLESAAQTNVSPANGQNHRPL